MKPSPVLATLVALSCMFFPACKDKEEPSQTDLHQIVVTSPMMKDVTITEPYVCQIHSQQHIEVRALEEGYLEQIPVKEGQTVKKNEVMFKVIPTLYQKRLNAELAEAQLAQLELNNTRRLFETNVVSMQEVALFEAKLAKAQAKAELAKAELNFTEVRAPFEGIVDRLRQQQGSLVKKEEILTTLSDNSLMWVYFNVPEKRYLDYMVSIDDGKQDPRIELLLADGRKYPYTGTIVAIEAKFNNETGNIPFRADFENPKKGAGMRLLRHGQTGTILIHRKQTDAIVIPQRATFEMLDKRYVWVVGSDGVVHQREITIQNELDDIFVIEKGIDTNDKIILEGVKQVSEGKKLEEHEYAFRSPADALANQKNRAE